MANLTAKTAFDGRLPLHIGTVSLTECDLGTVTWIAPHHDQAAKVSTALKRQMGADLPAPNRAEGTPGKRVVWFGANQALVLGPVLKPIKGAAMIDHSSAWAACQLQGPGAAEVLARLVPIDLRLSAFPQASAARTLLGHLNCVLMRDGPEDFTILVYRSMAQSCLHDLDRALRMVAARAAAGA